MLLHYWKKYLHLVDLLKLQYDKQTYLETHFLGKRVMKLLS